MIGSFPDSQEGKWQTRQKEHFVQTHRHEIARAMWTLTVLRYHCRVSAARKEEVFARNQTMKWHM